MKSFLEERERISIRKNTNESFPVFRFIAWWNFLLDRIFLLFLQEIFFFLLGYLLKISIWLKIMFTELDNQVKHPVFCYFVLVRFDFSATTADSCWFQYIFINNTKEFAHVGSGWGWRYPARKLAFQGVVKWGYVRI